jgi:hypothetical protein
MLNNLILKENGDKFVGYGKEHSWIHKYALWELPCQSIDYDVQH